jgi:hypothetical protein
MSAAHDQTSTCAPSVGLRTYGLCDRLSVAFLGLPLPRRICAQCSMAIFVPVYRCGAAPDSHRVPF